MKFYADNTEYRNQNKVECVFLGNSEKELALTLSNVPGTTDHYIEWNDQSSACTNGVKKMRLGNDELHIQLSPNAAERFGFTEFSIQFEVEPPVFVELQEGLKNIFGDLLAVETKASAPTARPPAKDYSQIKYLNLEGKKLVQLPGYVAEMKALETAKLGYNPKLDFQAACEVLAHLPNLKHLSVSALKIVPENLGQLSKLEILTILDLVEPCTLPESIGNLKNLKYLLLMSDSEIMLPESFSELTALEDLNIRAASWNLPEKFYQLSKLKLLDFTNCRFERLNPETAKMPAVETVVLDRSAPRDFAQVMSVVAQMPHLKSLELCTNPIPKEIGLCKNIETLVIRTGFDSQYPLELPEELFELAQLQKLLLHINYLKVIPESICRLKGLKQFICQESNIETLPNSIGEMSNLELLSIIENPDLKTLPDGLGLMANLRELHIIDNPLLVALPVSAQNLTNLTAVSISNFETIQHVPEHWKPLLTEG